VESDEDCGRWFEMLRWEPCCLLFNLVACCLMAIFSGMDLLVFFYTNTCKIMLLYGQSQPVSEVAERCRFMTMLCRLIILTLLFNEN